MSGVATMFCWTGLRASLSEALLQTRTVPCWIRHLESLNEGPGVLEPAVLETRYHGGGWEPEL